MARLTEGFDHYYRPSADRKKVAFEQGLIVLDTNVLLHILRYSPQGREELLTVLSEIQGRLFVPYQVAAEFNRNRVDVVAQRRTELDKISADTDQLKDASKALMKAFSSRRTLEEDHLNQLEAARTTFFEVLDTALHDADISYDLDPDKMVGFVDVLTTRLQEIIGDAVAQRPTEQQIIQDTEEAKKRHAQELAPGFKDKNVGDYLWWAEVLRHKEVTGRPIVIISDDAAKGDWLLKQRSLNAGPHAVLLDDVKAVGATDLILLTTPDMLKLAQSRNPEKVSAATLDESREVAEPNRHIWSVTAYRRLLAALRATDNSDRADVIVDAARADGFVSRDRLYEIIGLDEESRSLRQFATPARNAMSALVAEGVVSKQAQEPLRAEYTGPGKAIGYSVPEEFNQYEKGLAVFTDSLIGFTVGNIEQPEHGGK